ncbi:hypothetical protein LCGC14_2181120, partial [marine sediment metagenome]
LREREIEVPKAPKAIPLVRAELFRQSVQRFLAGVPSDKELTKQFRELRRTGVPEERAREQLEENIVTTIKKFPTAGRFEGLEIEPTGRVTLKGDFVDISGVFGAAGDISRKLTRKVLRKVAKSTNASEIFGILKKEVSEISDSLARKLSRDFKDIKTVSEIQSRFSARVTTEITAREARVAPRVAREIPPKIEPLVAPKVAPRTVEALPEVARERGFIFGVKATVPELKIAGQYIPRETDKLAIRARNLVIDDIATAERLALTGTNDKAVATATELIKHYSELASRATGAEKIAFYDKIAEIAVEIAPKLTEQGRAIQAASILGRQTPEGQLRFAARTIQKYNESVELAKGGILGLRKKVPELTGEQAEKILKRAKDIQNMPDGIDKAMAFKKLQDEIADLIPSPWYKKLINLWKAGLLTGIKTSGLNTFSNLFHGISEVIKDIPAVVVDRAASLFTKERTLALTVRGVKGGIAEGFGKGIRYMRTGFDERNIAAKLDWRRVSFGKSKFAKAVQTYEETVFHLMGAEDQPFYYGAKARSLGSQSIAQGKNKGLKGKELQKFVQNLIENPTDDMLRYAANDAEIAVFQNRTVLGKVARAIQKVPGGEVVVPFGRTPSAVAMQIINYSPVGIVKTFV